MSNRMKKDRKETEELDNTKNSQSQADESRTEDASGNGEQPLSNGDLEKETEDIKNKLETKTKQCDEYLDKLQRLAAEFDNYKKRTAREKEAIYDDAVGSAVLAFLPVIDNLERAIQACDKGDDKQTLKDGIDLVFRQVKDVMKTLGVEDIKAVGESFDPVLHNAVMHVEDEAYGDNTVIEEFQKGYILKERVIRHSMVKVAN